jgi:hypothetical protein
MTLRPDIEKATLTLVRRVDPLASDRCDDADDEAALRAVTKQIDAVEAMQHPNHRRVRGRRVGARVTAFGPTPARSDRPEPGQARRPHQRLLAGSTLGLAGVIAALALALSGSGSVTSPAFALTRHRDGSVSVKIYRRSGVVGANRKLAAMGIHERLYAVSTSLSGVSHPELPAGPQSCLRDQKTGGLVHVIFPSAAAQQAAVGTGTYVPPSNAGNTGGPANNDTFIVIACPTTGPASTGSGGTRFLNRGRR